MKVKVSILTAAIAAVISASAIAEIQPLSGEQFTVGGEVGIGGYYKDATDSMDTDATHLTVKASYKNGGIVGYMEVDADADYGKGMADDIETDLDKLWVGYDFGFGVLSYGVENDTALDKVDGAGDLTVEFGMSAGDASDAQDVIKFQGKSSGFAYGVSYYEDGQESNTGPKVSVGDKRGYNGYVGFEGDMFSVYAGYEDQKNDEKVTSFSGNVDLDVVKLGANIWTNEKEATKEEQDGYYVSVAKAFGALEVSAGYGIQDSNIKANDTDDGNFNIGASYSISSNTYVKADFQLDKKKNASDAQNFFVKAGYTF